MRHEERLLSLLVALGHTVLHNLSLFSRWGGTRDVSVAYMANSSMAFVSRGSARYSLAS